MSFVDILSFHSLHKMQSEIPKDKASKKKKDRTWVEAAKIVSRFNDLPYRPFCRQLIAFAFGWAWPNFVFDCQRQIVVAITRILPCVNTAIVLSRNMISYGFRYSVFVEHFSGLRVFISPVLSSFGYVNYY